MVEGTMIDADWRVDKNGVMDFFLSGELEFGRSPFDLLTDWYGRLRYCIAYYSDNQDKLKELESICQRRIAGFVKFKFPRNDWNGNEEDHGYVDHQSMGLLDSALEKYNVSLEEFIFNDRFIVVIDGDEYCIFDKLVKTEMFNTNYVKDILDASSAFEVKYYTGDKDGENE